MNSLNQNLVSLIGGIVAVAIVAAGAWYIEGLAKSAPAGAATSSTQDYSTSGLDALSASGSMLTRLAGLQQQPQSEPQAVQFSTADLGRTDITKQE